ncbi:shikimate dehydrogenase [Tropicimonas isoalkanivorans]|uniref:Shikimate dehydrogenase (NADP(+)) n=1 Tax=Tropicimonas isoalkanivorans TaxID=441112 RepID=A0A1I1M6E4_9RHOB|nr:shikimate dehydrogenase [Tropicimonas isoalkanivorans]SFC80989.1 shikimate dehydrogenase [Tropicimonas isoalkanivorans]
MTDKIPLAGVIGSPIAHSLSPRLHGHWLKSYGIKGYYIPMDIAQAHLDEALRALPRMGFVGVNVTIPHKETVLRIAHAVTDRAALIGAANTLIFDKDGRIHADNTDGYAFLANMMQHSPGWEAKDGPAAVFGAGGAARAVISALLDAGAPEIRLANRSRARADGLRAEFGPRIAVQEWTQSADMVEGAATVVNTTSLGMVDQPPFPVSLDRLDPSAVVSDLVYVPLRTRFLELAAARGCQTVDGLGMLLHQATPGFERWFGRRPAVDEALRKAVLAR